MHGLDQQHSKLRACQHHYLTARYGGQQVVDSLYLVVSVLVVATACTKQAAFGRSPISQQQRMQRALGRVYRCMHEADMGVIWV